MPTTCQVVDQRKHFWIRIKCEGPSAPSRDQLGSIPSRDQVMRWWGPAQPGAFQPGWGMGVWSSLGVLAWPGVQPRWGGGVLHDDRCMKAVPASRSAQKDKGVHACNMRHLVLVAPCILCTSHAPNQSPVWNRTDLWADELRMTGFISTLNPTDWGGITVLHWLVVSRLPPLWHCLCLMTLFHLLQKCPLTRNFLLFTASWSVICQPLLYHFVFFLYRRIAISCSFDSNQTSKSMCVLPRQRRETWEWLSTEKTRRPTKYNSLGVLSFCRPRFPGDIWEHFFCLPTAPLKHICSQPTSCISYFSTNCKNTSVIFSPEVVVNFVLGGTWHWLWNVTSRIDVTQRSPRGNGKPTTPLYHMAIWPLWTLVRN